jgi:dTDP-4-dehydrorhamnose 3,5-epimerase
VDIPDFKLAIDKTSIEGLLIIRPKRYDDSRGWFMESFNSYDFIEAIGINSTFVQDNHSYSRQYTIRGLHYQLGKPQGKLVRIISGDVFGVVVDLRAKSATYGKWEGLKLSAKNQKQIWIPTGLAHGQGL